MKTEIEYALIGVGLVLAFGYFVWMYILPMLGF